MADFTPSDLPDELRPPAARQLPVESRAAISAAMTEPSSARRAGPWLAPLVAAGLVAAGVLGFQALTPQTAPQPAASGSATAPRPSPTPSPSVASSPVSSSPSVRSQSTSPAPIKLTASKQACLDVVKQTGQTQGWQTFTIASVDEKQSLAVLTNGESTTVCDLVGATGSAPMFLRPMPLPKAGDERQPGSYFASVRVAGQSGAVRVVAGGSAKGVSSVTYSLTVTDGDSSGTFEVPATLHDGYWTMAAALPSGSISGLSMKIDVTLTSGEKLSFPVSTKDLKLNDAAWTDKGRVGER